MVGEGSTEPTLEALLDRYRALTSETVEACTDLARRAIGGDREVLRDAWMTWAELAGKAVEASYLSVALAETVLGQTRDRA